MVDAMLKGAVEKAKEINVKRFSLFETIFGVGQIIIFMSSKW